MPDTPRPSPDSREARLKVYSDVLPLVEEHAKTIQHKIAWGGVVDGKLISSPEDFYDVCYRSEFDR
ncbi:MAG: hypothetical protein ACRC2T_02760, partial [Thermoguttaceae bacterium]